MSRTLDLRKLQEALADIGFMQRQDIQMNAKGDAISPALSRAMERALASSGGGHLLTKSLVGERIVPDGILSHLGESLKVLSNPRCGTIDGFAVSEGGIGIKTYGRPGGRWNKTNLTFSIRNPGMAVGVSSATVIAEITNAFNQWSTISNGVIAFTNSGGSSADVVVDFADEASQPELAGSPIGLAGYPGSSSHGKLWLDSEGSWTSRGIRWVALHEIGHVLGLGHDNDVNSLMYPYTAVLNNYIFAPGVVVQIDPNSRAAIRYLYGWRDLINLSDRATSDGPVFAKTTLRSFTDTWSQLYMAWKEVGDDKQVYLSELVNNKWTQKEKVPDGFSVARPGMCEVDGSEQFKSSLLMAWRGVEGDGTLYWSIRATHWSERQRITESATSARPVLTNWRARGGPVMAWKGVGHEAGIYYSFFQNGKWSPQEQHVQAATTHSPTLAVLGDRLYMFWKGHDGDSQIWYSSLGPRGVDIWSGQRPVQYTDIDTAGESIYSVGTSDAPSATTRGDRIILTWKGIEGDSSIWSTSFDGQSFGGQMQIPGSYTFSGPAICSADGFTHLSHRGVKGDNTLWWRAM